MSSPSFEAPSLELLAQLLPAYEFEAFIAQGGMGAVYKARQRSLDRDVAIKILPRELGEDPEFRQSFETEARAMARLNHPNLIGVYDSGDVDGMPYIVMEYVNGKSLYHSSYGIAVEPRQAVIIVKAICDGLAHAHENGVVHRDIKPANILLTPKAEPKIGDFGLARPAGSDGPGLVMGTPGYTAPEILRHPEHADKRSDLYAVGVILYELLTGQRAPEEGLVPAPSSACSCDAVLDKICQQSTHPNPAFRYSSAQVMVDALDKWLRSAPAPPVSAAPPRKMAAGGRPGPRPSARASSSTPVHTGGGNATLARNLVIIAGLLVVIALTWKHYQKVKADRAEEAAEVQRQKEVEEARAREAAALAEREERERQAARQAELAEQQRYANETPLESLARLKDALVAGDRRELPKGTVRHGGFHYFPVPTPMAWHEAAAFAEDHGGHLAVLHSDEDLNRFAPLVSKAEGEDTEAGLWIGAGRAGRDLWIMVDGSPWTLSRTPVGTGHFAVVNELGLLRARRAGERFPFLIQWHEDGSNPGTLAAILQRTRDSLDSSVSTFPPGTLAYQGRHVLVIPHPATAEEAAQFAEQGGGHLAVPASRDEAGWLSDRLEDMAGEGYWIGAVRIGAEWKWTTGEKWDFAQWAEGEPGGTGDAAVIVPGQGWKSADPATKMTGFIIEWSKDRDNAETSAADDMGAENSDIAALDAKARELLATLDKDRQKELAANARTFAWDLDVWLRDLSKNENTRWKPEIEKLKALVSNNRVPDKVGKNSGIRLSERMAKISEYTAAKQVTIDAAFKTKAVTIRDAYLTRLRAAKTSAEGRGQTGIAREIDAKIETASDIDTWLEAMGFGISTDNAFNSIPFSFEGTHWAFLRHDKARLGTIKLLPGGKIESRRYAEAIWEESGDNALLFKYAPDDVQIAFRFNNEERTEMIGRRPNGTRRFLSRISN